jgi:hypothetical protein
VERWHRRARSNLLCRQQQSLCFCCAGRDTYSNPNSDAYTHSYCYTDANSHSNSKRDTNANPDGNPDTVPYRHSYGNTHRNARSKYLHYQLSSGREPYF